MTLDGLPFQGAEVDIVSVNPIEVYNLPELNYASGSFINVDVSNGYYEFNLTQLGSDGLISTVLPVISSGDSNIYVWQWLSENIGQSASEAFVGELTSTPNGFGGSGRVAVREGTSFIRLDNSATQSNITSISTGTAVLDRVNRSIRVYDNTGTLVNIVTATGAANPTADSLYLMLYAYGSTTKKGFVYLDKTTFPYDITQGDLGAYLAANPNWKQIGEQNNTQEILSLGRTTTDANGVFSINIGEYSNEVFASVYLPPTYGNVVNDFDLNFGEYLPITAYDGKAFFPFYSTFTSTPTVASATYSSKKIITPTGKYVISLGDANVPSPRNLYFITSGDVSSISATTGAEFLAALYLLPNTIIFRIGMSYQQARVDVVDSNGTVTTSTYGTGNTGYWGIVTVDFDAKQIVVYRDTVARITHNYTGDLFGDMTLGSAQHRDGYGYSGDTMIIFKKSLMTRLPSNIDNSFKEVDYQNTFELLTNAIKPQVKRFTPVFTVHV